MARILVYEAIDIDNFDNIRKRLTSPSKTSFRSSSISSTTFSILYHKKIEINNDLLDKKFTEPVNSSQLSYISNMALALKNMPKPQGKSTNSKDSNTSQSDDIINIQLLYNSNQPIEPELWDGIFQSISLHSSLEYFPFNSKNIKKSLC